MYENIYGLSCVDNQVLGQLKSNGTDISVLYVASDISFESLFDEMVINGIKPEYFSLIPKIQDILKDAGAISLELKNSSDMDEIINILSDNEYKVLIKLKPDFVKSKLFARGLREDHYVYIEKKGNNYTIYNDIPETKVVVPFSELNEIYSGNYFVFKILRSLSKDDTFYIENKCPTVKKIIFPIKTEFINDINNIGQKFRNFMWIYKLLVYRFTECNSKKISKKRIKESRDYVDNVFAMAEYFNLKKSDNTQNYCELINEVYKADCALKSFIV